MSVRRGIPFVLSAASGTGKTTLSQKLLDDDQALRLSISFTTRAPRGAEKNGVEYHFVDDATFRAMIDRGAFIEHALVHGNRYGSSKEWTAAELADGHDVVFDIDVQGGKQIKGLFPDAVLIFILPPSWEELERRLRRRGTDSDDVIARRLAGARGEIDAGLADYDYLVVNDDLARAAGDLMAIVRAHRIRTADRGTFRRNLLK